ncbi:MAG: twin-arginine translocation signal domain-containing protein [Lentisphaerae bacterium]|nr:twin-arginine translocation signal domain-containing protein [Lentisphaerota bacterium]
MDMNRRDFLKGTAWMGATAALAGCVSSAARLVDRGGMTAFAAPALKKVRVGVAGLGMRGSGAVHRLASIPGVEVSALCDLYQQRVTAQQNWLKQSGKPAAAEYTGPEGYKAMCESDLDLIYVVTPWALHTPVALYAMNCGKHAAVEVPAAMTLDECWACVETSERTGRHCMQLENCCYGEVEMLTLNLVRKGLLGDIVHGEGAYIHDLRELNYLDPVKGGYQGYWRLKWNEKHFGNPYPTHGLLPIMQAMNVNRGDRFDYLTCVSSGQFGMDAYAKAVFGEQSWQAGLHPKCGDMSTTVIRTVKGRSIMVQHDVTSPRPYSRINLVSGTLGCLCDYPLRIALASKPGDPAHGWFDGQSTEQIRVQHRHPLWQVAGELAQKVGGHGGMDFLMDLRLMYCLQNGLPLDMDVYDLAASCSICELSERSALNRGASQDVPDFTRGGWKTAKPLGIESVDISKFNFGDVKKDDAQLNV